MSDKQENTVRVRLIKSTSSCQGRHRLSVKALGLRRINDVRELKDSPSVRGLIAKIGYLIRVED